MAIRRETTSNERSRSNTSVTSEIRSTNTNERSLRNWSCSACSTDRKKTLALVTLVDTSQSTYSSGRRGRRGRYFSSSGTPPVWSEARIVRRTSTCHERRRPRCSRPCEASRRFSWATTRCTWERSWVGFDGQRAVELAQRLGGRQRLRALDHLALELAAHVLLELLEAVARHGVRIGLVGARALALQAERAADALHVHADHAGALALAAEGGDGEPGEVAHLAVRAGADRLADALAQRVEVDALAALEALLVELLLHRLALDDPEEEAVEQHVEHVPVLLRLGERGGERLAEVLARGPAHRVERAEGVEQLGGADRHALATQLVGELEQARRHAGRPDGARACRRRDQSGPCGKDMGLDEVVFDIEHVPRYGYVTGPGQDRGGSRVGAGSERLRPSGPMGAATTREEGAHVRLLGGLGAVDRPGRRTYDDSVPVVGPGRADSASRAWPC